MRVRFAPSPTGALHVGGARTALYNWLLARQSGGKLILRIEDTDRERSTPENVAQIIEALEWMELDWDEGPLSQAESADRHRAVVAELLQSGHAYEHEGSTRLRVPDDGQTVVQDLIRGPVAFQHAAIDDFTIARSDGSPLYNLAVAVDDLDSGITHVIRGEDHLSNTPRQVMILRAMGHEPPIYAHLPLLHGHDGRKLSKRHGATSVQELRDSGYLPGAVRNYLALLGWGYDDKQEIFTLEELTRLFSIDRVSKSPAVFDDQKLQWMNTQYIRSMDPTELTRILEARTARSGLRPAVELTQEKMQTLDDFWRLAGFFYDGPIDDPKARAKFFTDEALPRMAIAAQRLAALSRFDQASIEAALRSVVAEFDCKPKDLFQPIRVAISGTSVSPGIFESIELLGQAETVSRIEVAITSCAG